MPQKSRRQCVKNDFHIFAPVTSTFDLVTFTFNLLSSKLRRQLLLTWLTSPLSLNVVHVFVFELTVGTGQTDGQTDGCNA